MIVFFLILSPIVFVTRVDACMCTRNSPCTAIASAPTIFLAKVSSIYSKTVMDNLPNAKPYEVKYARFKVLEAFKGITESEIEMKQGTGGGDCSFVFEKDEQYLIYAGYDAESNRYYTNICTRSTLLAFAGEDLDYLRNPTSTQGNRLTGTLFREDYWETDRKTLPELLSGIKINILGENNARFETYTNDKGVYKFTNLPVGSYEIEPMLPSHLTLAFQSQSKIEIPKEGCASVGFVARTDGRISGRVLDDKGQPVPKMRVDLIPLEVADRIGDAKYGRVTDADAQGYFEFKELRRGKYLLAVNHRLPPDGDRPFSRTYYSGVSNYREAKVIELGEGEKLTGFELKLPSRLPTILVKGQCVWANGKPVAKTLITLRNSASIEDGRSLESVQSDEQGRFVLSLIKGTEGWIHCASFIPVNSGIAVMAAKPFRIMATSKQKPIKLIVVRKTKGGVTFIN